MPLIVLEGTDGSGKSTQCERFCAHLAERGRDFRRLSFPRYGEPSAALVEQYLSGAFGDSPGDVNAYAASLFYAADRCASYLQDWRGDLLAGRLCVCDRYTTSNAVHQAAKLPESEREGYCRWLFDFEYRLLGLPRPDLVLLLDLPADEALRRLRARGGGADIHERDPDYLRRCRDSALLAARLDGWTVVNAAARGEADIFSELRDRLDAFV